MKNITHVLNQIYVPQKALLVHRSLSGEDKVFVEAYDMDENGNPINAHPLSLAEMSALADCLNACRELSHNFLISKSILPEKILYTNPSRSGYAIWYTPSQKVKLYFKNKTGVPGGKANVPAMIWKAGKTKLSVYAIKTKAKPDGNTPLFHAPFFNIYKTGKVCMGTVEIEIANDCGLEDFMEQWESYFWNSYFSHLLDNFSPVKTNIVQLWQQQVNTDKPFPSEVLIKYGKTLKDLIQ